MQDTGAPAKHDKPSSQRSHSYCNGTRQPFFWNEPEHIKSPFSNFSLLKGGSNSQSLGRQSSVLPLSQAPSHECLECLECRTVCTITVMYQDLMYHFWIECIIHIIYRELLLTFICIVLVQIKLKHVVNMCI